MKILSVSESYAFGKEIYMLCDTDKGGVAIELTDTVSGSVEIFTGDEDAVLSAWGYLLQTDDFNPTNLYRLG